MTGTTFEPTARETIMALMSLELIPPTCKLSESQIGELGQLETLFWLEFIKRVELCIEIDCINAGRSLYLNDACNIVLKTPLNEKQDAIKGVILCCRLAGSHAQFLADANNDSTITYAHYKKAGEQVHNEQKARAEKRLDNGLVEEQFLELCKSAKFNEIA